MNGYHAQRGVGLIEVLIALVVVSIALLGLAALQGKVQRAEMESYQRSQALILLQDMSSRLRANRAQRAIYVTEPKMAGCGVDTTRAAQDLCEWSKSLAGASETLDGAKVGAMIAGHGCITGSGDAFEVIVEWQGLTPVTQTTSKRCDQPEPPIPDTLRRTMSVPVRFFTP